MPRSEADLVSNIDRAANELKKLNWRLYDLSVMPVRRLDRSEGTGGDDEEARR